MKNNELRIGNYITFHSTDDIEKVMNLTKKFVNKVDIQDIKPIPLSKKRLEKLCFAKLLDGWYQLSTANGNLILFNIQNKRLLIGDGRHAVEIYRKITHVHELQNIFYDITGLELNFS